MSRRGSCVALWAAVGLAILAGCGDGEATVDQGPESPGTTEAHWALVCLAPNQAATVMPDVAGMELRPAVQQVCDLGIRLGDIDAGPDATVYEQHPAPGDPVDAGTRADLKAR